MKNTEQALKSNEKPSTCIIYTRANHNQGSLQSQREICEQFANAKGIQVLQYFEGYAGDTQREFERMIAFAKANFDQLKFILVSTFDRFYRSSSNIMIMAELQEKFGVRILAADHGLDSNDSTYGEFIKALFLLTASYDKSIRRDRILEGKKRRALSGYWAGVPPRGYAVTGSGRNVRLVLTEEAELIKEAFKMRSEGSSVTVLRDWLRSKGFNIGNSPLHKMLRNCFYAGYIKSVYIPEQLVGGSHPPIIDADTFFLINKGSEGNRSSENLNSEK